MPIAAILSVGLLTPVASRLTARFLARGYRYGDATFAIAPRLGALYAALGRSVLLFITILLLCLLVSVLAGITTSNPLSLDGSESLDIQNQVSLSLHVLPTILTIYAVLSLTLAYPWARVRQYRYLMQSMSLLAAPGLDELVSRQQKASDSFGSEFSELAGFASAAAF